MISDLPHAEEAPGVRGVDLWDRGLAHHTSGYVIAAPSPALVEAGAARSTPVWLRALADLGIAPADLAYIIVTHIHLDHAGGIGTLLRHAPAARVVVHRHGARHLIDPSRLVAGARQVFGDNLESYFGLPEPVPEARLLVPEPGAELDLGGGHRLRFFDASGHARHQHMILDGGAGCLFSGDELGGRFADAASDYVLPDTAPNQFDPDAMLRSADLLRTLRPEGVLFSHFGRYPRDGETLRRRLHDQVGAFVALGNSGPQPPRWEQVHPRLVEHVQRDLAARGVAWTAAVERALADHLEVSAQGIVDYHRRHPRDG
ncbi:MAG TPA: MBL fold metallo-hydrolase [bacterium]|nr:MBL fold metallo-hydrolase [bacterium]